MAVLVVVVLLERFCLFSKNVVGVPRCWVEFLSTGPRRWCELLGLWSGAGWDMLLALFNARMVRAAASDELIKRMSGRDQSCLSCRDRMAGRAKGRDEGDEGAARDESNQV